MKKKGNARIMGAVLALVFGAIGFSIVDEVFNDTTWVSSLSTTIAGYVVPISLLALLSVAAFAAYKRR